MSLKWLLSEFKKDWQKVPNLITLSRLIFGLLPAFLLATGLGLDRAIAFYLFIFLISTDWVDGFVARTSNQTTKIGRILDPIADRLITGSTLIVLIFQNVNSRLWLVFVLSWFLFAAIIISIIIYRASRNHVDAKPNKSGKIKTVLISVLVVCLIGETLNGLEYLSVVVPYLAVITLVVSIISFLKYIMDYSKVSVKE